MVTLVCGDPTEAPLTLLIESLTKKKAGFLIIDQQNLAEKVQVRWQLTNKGITGQLRIDNDIVSIQELSGVYHRFINIETLYSSSAHPATVRSVLYALIDLFDILPIRIVNRRRPMMSNNSKPYQSLLIRKAGFAIPETFISNDSRAVFEFTASKKQLIYKSMSSVRSIVETFSEKRFKDMDSLRFLPTQFQEKIEGFNVRVHVVGQEIFATRIISGATDYRYPSRENQGAEFRPYEINVKLQRKCVDLTRSCGLEFAGIDLMITESEVYCLEVNPSPGYSYYQEKTGQNISDALAELLINDKI